MKFTVIVSSSADKSASQNALSFCNALTRQNHTLDTLFFVGEGVSNADRTKEQSLRWQNYLADTKLTALCCSRSAANQSLADKNGRANERIQERFKIAGLGQLVASTENSDRVVTFGQDEENKVSNHAN